MFCFCIPINPGSILPSVIIRRSQEERYYLVSEILNINLLLLFSLSRYCGVFPASLSFRNLPAALFSHARVLFEEFWSARYNESPETMRSRRSIRVSLWAAEIPRVDRSERTLRSSRRVYAKSDPLHLLHPNPLSPFSPGVETIILLSRASWTLSNGTALHFSFARINYLSESISARPSPSPAVDKFHRSRVFRCYYIRTVYCITHCSIRHYSSYYYKLR